MSAEPFIVRAAWQPYIGAMLTCWIRLLTLIAVALMPFGMASAPASVMPLKSVQAGHCDDHKGEQRDLAPAAPAEAKLHCASCTALPALHGSFEPEPLEPAGIEPDVLAGSFGGIQPEIATPPPRA